MADKAERYQIYLLRCWEVRGRNTEQPVWRFCLKDPQTGKQYGFPTLEAMSEFLRTEMGSTALLHTDSTDVPADPPFTDSMPAQQVYAPTSHPDAPEH